MKMVKLNPSKCAYVLMKLMFSLERLTSLLTDLVINKEAIEEDSAAMKVYAKVMDNVGDRLS